MSFDNLTLAGLLLTLPYIAMLVMVHNRRSAAKFDDMFVLEYSENEPYRYGA